jgi:hypothetical protein
MVRAVRFLFGAAIVASFASSRPLKAAEPTSAPPESADLDEATEVPLVRPRPAAPDTRTGHVLVTAKAGFVGPAGSFADGLRQSRIVATSPSFGGAIGIGIGRSAVLEVAGEYAKLAASRSCAPSCSGSTFDLGLGLVFHVAQGLAIDPWVSYAVAFRSTSFSIPDSARSTGLLFSDATSSSYKGIDVARFALGGDFYPIPELGFGPFLEADFGSYFWRPEGSAGAAPPGSVYAFFGLGLRVTLEPMRLFSEDQ